MVGTVIIVLTFAAVINFIFKNEFRKKSNRYIQFRLGYIFSSPILITIYGSLLGFIGTYIPKIR